MLSVPQMERTPIFMGRQLQLIRNSVMFGTRRTATNWKCGSLKTRDGVTQWYPLMTDMTAEEVKQAVEQAQSDANTATEKPIKHLTML